MQLSTPSLGLVERTATVYRLLTVALAALAILLTGQADDPRVVSLGAGYLTAIGIVWLLASRVAWSWLVYLVAFVDVGAVTSVIGLLPEAPLPLWALYLLPLAAAAAVGSQPAAVAAALTVVGYFVATWATTNSLPVLVFWPVTVLVAATFLVVTLSARWLVERQEKRAWQQLAASLRGLEGLEESEDAAAVVAERARRLVHGDRAWLWWCGDAEVLRPGAQVGRPFLQGRAVEALSPGLMRRLSRGPVPLRELGGDFGNLSGEVALVRHGEMRVALLAVAWEVPSFDRVSDREKLRAFVPSAASALLQVRARAALREELRREVVLRRAAESLASTLERQVAYAVVLRAARTGLNAAAALVGRPSGRILSGDVEVAEALLRRAVEAETRGKEAANAGAAESAADTPLSVDVDGTLALLVWRQVPPFGEAESLWVEQLAALAGAKLSSCASHEALRGEEQRLRDSLEAMPAPLVLRDGAGTILLSNAAFRRLGELRDLPGLEVGAKGERAEEIVVGHPPRTFVVTTARLPGGIHLLSAFREITRERDALRAKEELIAMVGHELRSPLTSIYGYSQLMSRQLGVVQQQVNQLNHMIVDFVQAAQMEGAQLPIVRERVNLSDVVRSAAERFRGAHQGRPLRLELAQVPLVEGDPVRLAQVVDNLLGNAAKYSTPEQEIVVTVGVREGQVALSVSDHGIGIAAEHLSRLFDRFYRVPNDDTQRVKGLGLGLSIVRDLVTAHGGRVWAESPGPGQGSSFCVTLPAAESRAGLRLLPATGSD